MDCIKNHKQGAEILMDYCAGTLDPGKAAQMETHTRQCPDCRALVEAQNAVWESLDAWTPVEVSRDFDSRLYARIASEQSGPSWLRWWRRLSQPATPYAWWKPMVSMAVAGAIVSMALIVHPVEHTASLPPKSGVVQTTPQAVEAPAVASAPSPAPAAAGSEDIDLQQVEQALDDLDIVAPMNQTAPNQTAPSPL